MILIMLKCERGDILKYKGYDLSDKVKECYCYEEKADFLISKINEGIAMNTIRVYATTFAAISVYEKQFKSNILNMSPHKMAAVFEMYASSYANYQRLYNLLKNYYAFYDKDFSKLNISFNGLNISGNYENKYVRDLGMLDELILEAFPDYKTGFDMYRALGIYLSFLGFRRKDLVLIKKEDVNIKDRIISYNGQIVKNIPQHIISLCESCMSLTTFSPGVGSPFEEVDGVGYRMSDSDYLLRSMSHSTRSDLSPCSNSYLNRIMSSFNEGSQGEYSFDTIRYSGLFEWLYSEEKAGRFSVNFTQKKMEEIFSDHLQYHCSPVPCIKNYKIWREVFYGY